MIMSVQIGLFNAASLFGGKAFRIENLTENDVGSLSLTGLLAVFTGLAVLCLFMIALGKILNPAKKKKKTGTAKKTELDTSKTKEKDRIAIQKTKEEDLGLDIGDPCSIDLDIFALTMLARHLFDEKKISLGEEVTMTRKGHDHQVKLLSIGRSNVAVIDGEEIQFTNHRVAPADDETGRKIADTKSDGG